MTISIPTRETAAATVGPRLDISPADLRVYLQQQHGLTSLISGSKSWDPFAWKGNDLSSPMRALWVAEHRGLLIKSNSRSTNVLIDDITADTNEYLRALGKREITIGTTLNALRKAAKYVNVAVGCSVIADSKTMSVRFVDQYESAESVQRYYDKIEVQLKKLSIEVQHAKNNDYNIEHILAASAQKTGVALQLVGSAS